MKNRKYLLLLLVTMFFYFITCQPAISQDFDGKKVELNTTYGKWKLTDQIQVYNPDNLFDIIDGAADHYLSYNFKELIIRTYQADPDNYINIEIYNHQALDQAFGIYVSERPTDFKTEKIGTQGYQGDDYLNFFIDRFYVKLSTHNTEPETKQVMLSIANDIADKLSVNKEFPSVLKIFPELNKINNSEVYINTNFLGYEFLQNAFVAEYVENTKQFKIFIIRLQSPDKAKALLYKYASVVKSDFNGTEGKFIFQDPNNGKINLEWRGNFIWGLLNEKDIKIKNDYLQLVKEKIDKSNL